MHQVPPFEEHQQLDRRSGHLRVAARAPATGGDNGAGRRASRAPRGVGLTVGFALPAHTSIETAADLLWLYTSPEIYRMLVIEQHWSAKRYRGWFHAAVASILT